MKKLRQFLLGMIALGLLQFLFRSKYNIIIMLLYISDCGYTALMSSGSANEIWGQAI